MYMKKFIVESIQEGWKKINDELGENAIIINISQSEDKLEIIAASPNKKDVSDDKFKNPIEANFKTEKDFEGLESLLNFLIKLKPLNLKKKKFISDYIYTNFSNYINSNDKELLNLKVEGNSLAKKFITVLGGIATGKTTTIAKLASILKFSRNKKIAIASFDFFKISGFDSLKKFAEIMQIPFFPIKNEKDIISYKDSFEDYDHIIFDTPGNLKELKDIEKFVNYVVYTNNSENILTISLDKKESIIKKELEYFAKFNISHVILTKFDELSTEEELFITLSNIPYKVSYITNGLNVPTDIFEFKEIFEKLEAVKL